MQILWDGRGFLSDKSINRGIVFTCKTKLASAWTRSTTGASPCHDLGHYQPSVCKQMGVVF